MINLLDKKINILHVEDNDSIRKMVKFFLKKSKKINIINQSTIMGAKRYLKIDGCDPIDIIICDWMIPVWDAEHIIRDLYILGKPVIFYTCLDEREIKSKVRKILGCFPRNFKHIQKGAENNLLSLSEIINDYCC